MATVKIKFRKSIQALENYVFEHKEPDDPVSFYNCKEDFVAEKFLATQDYFGKRNENQAIHIIQSWCPEESKKMDAEKLNELGVLLTEKYFPGHDYAIVTHTDTDNTHNHIIVNPVHSETGERINNKTKHLYKLREINDALALENGLSIVETHSRENWEKKSDKVKAIEGRTGSSKSLDLKEKARFAMSVATSFDEYSAYLERGFGIKVKIRGKSVSYLYPGNSRFKRCDKIGAKFAYEGLVKRFKENDNSLVIAGLKTFEETEGKDYGKAHRFKRDEKEYRVPEEKLKGMVVSPKFLEDMRRRSIEKYCKERSISLVDELDGYRRLSGREYVRIKSDLWENERNNTSGSFLEFISNLEKTPYLKTLCNLSDDLDYSQLSTVFEIVEPSFRSFYVPDKDKAMTQRKAISALSSGEKISRTLLTELSRAGRVKVYDPERFKVFPQNTRSQSLTYYRSKPGVWYPKRTRGLKSEFLNIKGKSNELYIFASPLDFLRSKYSEKLLKESKSPVYIASPLESIDKWVSEREGLISSFKKARLVRFDAKDKIDEMLVGDPSTNKGESKVATMTVADFDAYIKREFLSKSKKFTR